MLTLSCLRTCSRTGRRLRQTLAKEANQGYDFLLVDAFSSDAIPIHLITQEAIALYMTKLRDDGILAVHISNRYLNLVPVLTNIARTLGLRGMSIERDPNPPPNEDKFAPSRATVMLVVLGRNDAVASLDLPADWIPLDTESSTGSPWTDGRSSVLEAFVW